MSLRSTRHLAFNAIDRFLHGIDQHRFRNIHDFDSNLESQPFAPLFHELMNKYDLYGWTGGQGTPFQLHLNMRGMTALDCGGIREYILDHDKDVQFYDGFPQVIKAWYGEELMGKWLINSNEEYVELCESLEHRMYRIENRTTRRPGVIDLGKTSATKPNLTNIGGSDLGSHDTSRVIKLPGIDLPTQQPPTPTITQNWYVKGPVINGQTGHVTQNLAKGNTANIGNIEESTPPPEAKSWFWKWTERYGWIAGIIGGIGTIITLYLMFKNKA